LTSYVTPKKNTAFIMYAALVDASDSRRFKSGPTIAAGDFKVSKDGGAFANLTNLPVATGVAVQLSLTSTEMNADNVTISCIDQTSPPEWLDQVINIQTSASQIDDLATAAALSTSAGLIGDLWSTFITRKGQAQAGAAGTVTLDAGASATDDLYTNQLCVIFSGTGIGGVRRITAYNGTTKVATVSPNWQTNPSSASFFYILKAGVMAADVEQWLSATAPANTGDAFARLGAPAGASVSADLVTIASYIDTEVGAIKAKTDNLPALPAAVSNIPTANQNADALLDRVDGVETGLTFRSALRLMAAVLFGKASGLSTTTAAYRDSNDTKNRIVATVDVDGNRTAVTKDAS
jgi:hypothetical protein